MPETSYPLVWPSHIPRKKIRFQSAFVSKKQVQGFDGPARAMLHARHHVQRNTRKTLADALLALQLEVDRMRHDKIAEVLSTNLRTRLDGYPRADQAQPTDPGAALYFNRGGQRICMPCDKWNRVEDNIYAIAMHINAMRGMERWGVGTTEQAFAGYKALTTGENWWDVLGVERSWPVETIQKSYRLKAMQTHQHGGDLARLNIARDQALIELGVKQP
jgi:hypothetical protein